MKKLVDIDKAIEKIEQGGNAWEETDEVVTVEIKKPLDKPISSLLAGEE